ncbi:FBD-associated F-box protein At5g60610-like [Silene latifolia]|uniref:FBD-associated F-box protein At5g60610-like n=1 Tax=Silene latifolia TaxID=37657 RepID=UPI003D7725AD
MSSEDVPTINRYHHRWSSLPDDIIFEIISRVGLPRKVVITVSASNFTIEQTVAPNYNIYELWTTLDNLFTVFIPPFIDTFSFNLHTDHYDEPRCWPIIDAWARRLSACNIQHFRAYKAFRYRPHEHVYPLSIFRMHSLISLDLSLCSRITSRAPYSIILPNLKKLRLRYVNYECLRQLLSCCPSLEDLSSSINESMKHLVSLTSKKLKRLCIILKGFSIVDVVIDTPILEELIIYWYPIVSVRTFESISKVRSLELHGSWARLECNPRNTITYPNLTDLKLVTCSPELFKAIGLMLDCPKLEVFVIYMDTTDSIKKMVWDQEAVFGPVEHVKHINLYMNTIVDIFSENIVNIVTLLLRSAKVLEKLTLFGYGPLKNQRYLAIPQFHQTLAECVEATSRCQLELLGAYKWPTEVAHFS